MIAARRRRRAPVSRVRPRARRDTLRQAPPAPAAPRAPAPGQSPLGVAAPPGGQLVDDATAAADRAALRFRTSQQRTDIEQQGAYDRTDFQEALRRMSEQRPRDEQATREGANREGLFYSGQLGKRLTDLSVDYQRRQGDAQLEFDRGEASRQAARRALESGMSIDDAAISASLAERLSARDADTAAAGALSAPPAPRPTRKPKPRPPHRRRRRRV